MHEPSARADHRNTPPVTSLDPRTAAAIAIGGVIGAILRFAIGELLGDTEDWPWAVFVVNLAGCVALGWLIAQRTLLPDRVFAAAAIGFCGSLTTFSAFAVDLAVMARDDRLGLFAGYLVSSFACGLVAFSVGRWTGRRSGPMAAPS